MMLAHSRRRRASVAVVLGLVVALFPFVMSSPASAGPGGRAGVGFQDAAINGWGGTDSMQGSFSLETDDGRAVLAYCVDHDLLYPPAIVSFVGDTIPGGAGDPAHDALAYLLARYGYTADPITAAALATIVHFVAQDGLFAPGQSLADVVIGPDADWGGDDWAVYDRIQSLWADGLAKRGPWTLSVSVAPDPYTTALTATAVLAGPGGAIAGEQVTFGVSGGTIPSGPGPSGGYLTDASGRVVVAVQGPVGTVVVNSSAASPPTVVNVYGAGGGTQSVAVPDAAWGVTDASDSAGQVPASFFVRKQSTSAYLSTAGAVFEVWADVSGDNVVTFGAPDALIATLVTQASGDTATASSPHVGQLHAVRETAAPPGHITAGPWYFTGQAGVTITVTAPNTEVVEGRLSVVKRDAQTNATVTGGSFAVDYDADANGTYETHIGDHQAGTQLTGLRAGNYQVTETVPPAGYTLPEVRTQTLFVDWDADPVAEFTFVDGRPEVTTQASVTVRAVGESVDDVVELGGVASTTTGTLTVTFHGPFAFGAAAVCDASTVIAARSVATTGSGTFTVGPYVGPSAGVYTFVASWQGSDGSTATHDCGLAAETVVVAPSITTLASTTSATVGESVHDVVTVTDVPPEIIGNVTVRLFGPYPAPPTSSDCRASEQVWTATFDAAGSGEFASPAATVPRSGHYAFVATWTSADNRVEVTHPCGLVPESILVHPRLATTASLRSVILGTAVNDRIELTGIPEGWTGSITVSLFGPFAARDTIECREEARAATWSLDVSGPGEIETPEWVPADGEDTGWYTWVARYDGADGTSATHACGDDAESFFAQLAPGWFAVHKATEAHADEPVRGARYHLFVASSDLPAAYLDCTVRTYVQHVPTNCDDTYAATTAPTDLAGYRFVGEVATDAAGSFRAPAWAGARYCLREVAAPENWLVDPAVRCAIAGGTGSSDADSVTTSGAATVMLTNTRVMGTLRGRKFDASAPGQAIGGAEYAVYAMVDGAVALADSWFRDAPTNVPVVPGLRAFAAVTTDGDGSFAVAVPSGARWCVRETNAPAGWRADLSLLCTPAAVDSATLYTALIELPEQRLPPQLARTGSSHDVARAGILLAAVGLALHAVSGAHGARGAAAPARRSLRPPRRRARR